MARARLAEKSRISTVVTSEIMPRPYWAAAPDSWRSWATPTLVPFPDRAQRRGDHHGGLAAAPRLGAAGVHDDPLGRLVPLGDLRLARERELDRPHPDRHRCPRRSRRRGRWSARCRAGRRPPCGMSPKNSQTFSTGCATSKSFLISIGTHSSRCWRSVAGAPRRRRPDPLELGAAAGPAEVVGHCPSCSSGYEPGPASTVIPHTGSTAVGGAGAGAVVGTWPAGPHLDQLGQDGHRDLLVGGRPEVQAGRHPDPVQLVARHPALGQVAQHRRAALARPDQAQVGGPGRDRLGHRLLVAVPLGGHHDHRPLVGVGRGEVLPGDQRRPASRPPWPARPASGPSASGPR